nr:transposase zinc-binding domain-containing protein [Desulfocicer vacuolatum]
MSENAFSPGLNCIYGASGGFFSLTVKYLNTWTGERLHFGFAGVRCEECGHGYLLAFSCKRRQFYPFCHLKRIIG